MAEGFEDIGSSTATVALSSTASAMPDISTTSTAPETPPSLRMRSNTPRPDLGPIATAVISETVAAMVDSATTTALASPEHRVRRRLAPDNTSETPLAPTTIAVPLHPARGSSTNDMASSMELPGSQNSGEEKGLGVQDQKVPKPTESKPSPTIQQPRKSIAPLAAGAANDATSTTEETPAESKPATAPNEGDHSNDEVNTSDETEEAKAGQDRDGDEGSARGLDEAINSSEEEKNAQNNVEEKGESSTANDANIEKVEDYEQLEPKNSAEEKGESSTGTDAHIEKVEDYEQLEPKNNAEEKGESSTATNADIEKVEDDEQLEPLEDGGGRVVHSSAPNDGTMVWVLGRRVDAVIQVVERLRPSYRLIISVTVAARTPLWTQGTDEHENITGSSKLHLPRVSRTSDGAENMVAVDVGNGGAEAEVAASLSLGKSEIKAALESWVRCPVSASDNEGIASRPPSGMTDKGEQETNNLKGSVLGSEAAAAASAAEANLRRWITTGCAPRRAHLIRWLLQRLELVKGASAGTENEVQGRPRGEEGGPDWLLVISNVDSNSEKLRRGSADDKGGNVGAEGWKAGASTQVATNSGDGSGGKDRPGRQKPGGYAEAAGEDEEGSLSSLGKTFGDASAADTTAAPRVTPQQHRASASGGEQHRWRWWDNENPWSRGSMSSATTRTTSTDGKTPGCAPIPSPPAYRETVPPPPYRESTGDLSPSSESRSPASNSGSEAHERSPRAGSVALRDDASTSTCSGEDTSRGPPPSYRSVAAKGERRRLSSSARGVEDERENNLPARDFPPPSYGRFYDPHAATEWWAQDDDRRIYDQNESSERDRGSERRRRHVSPAGGGGNTERRDEQHLMFRDRPSERPETVDDKDQLRRLGESGGWQRRREVVGRKTSTAAAGSRPKASITRGKSRQKDASGLTLTGTESWDDDRWRLTRYLQSCKKELMEAEERRRRAEVAANAAERSAWKTAGNSNGGDDDASKRAWARAATQRVLDLMLVTERVRQEEQKRRVAAARANSQVARCKQPFRERRGRSQKGPVIGPSVPPANLATVPPSTHRTETTALDKFYWDEHGRRYARRFDDRSIGIDADEDDRGDNVVDDREGPSGDVGVALEAVREVANACLEEGIDFAQPFRDMDADGDGRLTLAELGAALRRAGARLSLSQVAALFRHFDEGLGLDTVGRGDFLWEFVNTGRLLKQWRKAGDGSGRHRARTAPFRHRAKMALSYSGGSDGTALSRQDVLGALAELGVHVDGWQAGALLDRFTAEAVNGGEQVDWRALVSFLQAAENEEDGINSKNDNNNASRDNLTDMAPDRRGRLHTTALPRRGNRPSDPFPRQHEREQQRQAQQRQRQNWATSSRAQRAVGGLFEGGGGIPGTSRSRPTRPTATAPTTPTKPKASTVPSTDDLPYTHWASSAPNSIGGRRNRNAAGGVSNDFRKSGTSQQGGGGDDLLGWTRDAQRRRSGGVFSMANAAETSRVLDRLLEDQRELEAFLEEEFAKRENGGDAGTGGRLGARVGFGWEQEV